MMVRRPRPQSPRWHLATLLLALALGATHLAGCMETRAAINRVQPDYLDKAQLVPVQYAALANGTDPAGLSPELIRREPQWYHQVTIIDKPATSGAAGVTSYTQVDRVHWEVTQNFLIARQAYDRLRGGQNDPNQRAPGNGPFQGETLAVYAIQSHFDIRRSYNATTGEELNIVEENTTDRPWYQRRFMRVDWSRNLVSGFTPLDSATWNGRVGMEPVPVFVNNPSDPNRPVFDYGEFNGQPSTLRYFDITNRATLQPETVSIPGYTALPACYLYDRINESCQPAEVTMRVAFRRVDPMRDYQPLAMDGHRMERFGFFEDARVGFSQYHGGPGQLERRHFANRHNLWMQHHVRMPEGQLHHQDGDRACERDADCALASDTARCDVGTRTCGEVYRRCVPSARTGDASAVQASADQVCGAEMPGSSCDLDVAYNRGDRAGLCLLPFRSRAIRPIPYHLSPNYPDRIMPVTQTVVAEWNRVFSHAVREARYRECLLDPQGGGPAGCESWRDLANLRPEARDSRFVYVGCHNPVWGTDPNLPGAHNAEQVRAANEAGWDLEACGPQGTVARIGDLRYSMIAAVTEYDQQGPWGLAGITGDPPTGEVLAGRGAVWQTVTDAQAAFATDLIRLLNREMDLSPERVALGQTVLDAYNYIVLGGGGSREERSSASGPMQFHPRPVHRDIASRDELANLLAATRFDHLQVVAPEYQADLSRVPELSRDALSGQRSERALLRSVIAQVREHWPSSESQEDSRARMARLRDTRIESMVMNNSEMLLAANQNPQGGVTPQAMEAVSPMRRNSSPVEQLRLQADAALSAHDCRYDAEASFSDDVIATLLYRFRRNQVPEDVRFGQSWDFHRGNPAACSDDLSERCELNYEQIQRYLTQYIHYGVLAHEIGHSVGERHNFSGSADAVNYFDRYWPLRRSAGVPEGMPPVRADALRPRWEHMADGQPFYSRTEEREGVEEYGYSTVMDYVGWNQDAHGLGRYDRAFVLHGYVDMVEAFDQVAEPSEALVAFESMAGGYQSSFRLSFVNPGSGAQFAAHHYTDVPRLVGVDAQGNPNITDANRYPVFLRETQRAPYGAFDWAPEHTNVTSANRDGTAAQDPHVLVPYRFGTDDWRNGVWNTQLYDAGADMFESMRYVSVRYQDYYFSNSFARSRASFTVNGYRARMSGRFLDQAYYSMRNHTYLESIYRNAYGNQANFNQVLNGPAVSAGRLGSALVVDMFANTVMTPQASALNEAGGRHCVRTRPDGVTLFGRGGSGTCVDVPIGAGREYSTYYDFNSGFWWRERIVNVGAFHDKDMSLQRLTDTFIWSPGRTVIEFYDPRPLQINMYTLFPGQTLRWFGSLLSRDYADVAPLVRPRVGLEPEIIRTQIPLINLPAGMGPGRNGRDPTLRPIDPNMGWSLELQALVYLFGQMGQTFDRTVWNSVRLWAQGDAWAIEPSAGTALVNFTNPLNGRTYTAYHVGGAATEPGAIVGLSARDAAANETGIAARMLLEAERLAEAYRVAMRGTNQAVIQDRRRELQIYVDLLDATRDLTSEYYR